MITGIDHIGIAVVDLDASIEIWERALGGKCVHREKVADQKVEVAAIMLGSLRIELITPTSSDSPVAKFLESRGRGIHHIALASTEVQHELDQMNALGIRLIDKDAKLGADGTRVGFIHPHSLDHALVEIVERVQSP